MVPIEERVPFTGIYKVVENALPDRMPTIGEIILQHNKDKTETYLYHECPCGCGGSRRLPVDPNTGWSYKMNNGYITITPSMRDIGFCNSHYNIIDGHVLWLSS